MCRIFFASRILGDFRSHVTSLNQGPFSGVRERTLGTRLPRLGLFEQSLKQYTAKASKSRSQSDHEITLWYKLEPSFKQTQVGEAI